MIARVKHAGMHALIALSVLPSILRTWAALTRVEHALYDLGEWQTKSATITVDVELKARP